MWLRWKGCNNAAIYTNLGSCSYETVLSILNEAKVYIFHNFVFYQRLILIKRYCQKFVNFLCVYKIIKKNAKNKYWKKEVLEILVNPP